MNRQCIGMKTNKSGLFCSILKAKTIGSCSLGGISETNETVLLVLPEGGPFSEERAIERGYPVCRLVKRIIGGREHLHVEPDSDGMWAAGGCFVTACDSRFPNHYPLALHDRNMLKEART